ncbi:Hypothetical protein NTJ_16216 [Nesidiocoris tenuis]|uniref:DDE Tnp4 domain-containing protein n=1 Tax=Nesidiocoris tenuis TaxID=355587 RepID=A0ABN7BHM7_9HEMI|nr:Hypothetical protein NTJ_16216 [Nesidiocoris tenuis]
MSVKRLKKRAVLALCLLLARRRYRRKTEPRRWWVNPSMAQQAAQNAFGPRFALIRQEPEKFMIHYGMSVASFDALLTAVKPAISKVNTQMRDCVSAEEKLAATLRYLRTGSTCRELQKEFIMGRSTLSIALKAVCLAIYNALKTQYMKEPKREDWLTISEGFEEKTGFPHCVGAIGAKYIRIKTPWGPEKDFFKFKKSFCIALIGVVDHNHQFSFIDVGGNREETEGNLLKATEFGDKIYSYNLDLPLAQPLRSDPNGAALPFIFVNEVFPESGHILRPYSRTSNYQSQASAIFNEKFAKAMEVANETFAILTERWRIFENPFTGSGQLVNVAIKACCALHNYVGKRDGFDLDCLRGPGFLLPDVESKNGRTKKSGDVVRDQFAEYFCSTGWEAQPQQQQQPHQAAQHQQHQQLEAVAQQYEQYYYPEHYCATVVPM